MQLVIPQHPTTPNIVKKFHAGQNFFKNLKSGRQKYFQDGSNTHIHTHGVAETLCTTTHQYTHTPRIGWNHAKFFKTNLSLLKLSLQKESMIALKFVSVI